jgi:hypothetical protein
MTHRLYMQDVALLDCRSSKFVGISVVSHLKHPPADVCSVTIEKLLDERDIDATLPFGSIQPELSADRPETPQTSKPHTP